MIAFFFYIFGVKKRDRSNSERREKKPRMRKGVGSKFVLRMWEAATSEGSGAAENITHLPYFFYVIGKLVRAKERD